MEWPCQPHGAPTKQGHFSPNDAMMTLTHILTLNFQPQSSSTPRKPSTPYQLWREEHIKQEMGIHQSVIGTVPTMPTLVTRSITDPILGRATSPPSRPESRPESSQSTHQTDSSTGGRKHPPTRLYIESDPQQKVETFVRWKQQQQERELRSRASQSDAGSETQHLSELERQIEAVQQIEGGAVSDASAASTYSEEKKEGEQKEKKEKRKKSSLSSMISSVFTRKKTSSSPLPKKKKSSLGAMIEAQGAPSILDPEAQQKIIDRQEPEPTTPPSRSPYQEWRTNREQHREEQGGYLAMGPPRRPDDTAGSRRGPTPDPDYDNMSIRSDSSLGSMGPRAPRIREEESEGSEVGSDYGGRFTPRSAKSEYGRRIPDTNSTSLFTGFGRGTTSPSPSATPPPNRRERSSVDSFFGKNGATVAQSSDSQIWYQKYKHTSFSHQNENTFGDPIYGTFDGRITSKRGEPLLVNIAAHLMDPHFGLTQGEPPL